MEKVKLTDKQLEILHDHYKETFSRIREEEKSRDRHFLAIIGLFALLSLGIGYPAALGGSLGTAEILGGQLHLDALPLPALRNLTWVFTFVIVLKYCRLSVWIGRQYPYLHYLEEHISSQVGGDKLYKREGEVYLTDYPLLLDVSWFTYSILFPLLIMGAALWLVMWERQTLSYPYHQALDLLMALAIAAALFLYRVEPYISARSERWRKIKTRRGKQTDKEPPPVTPGQESPLEK